MRASVPGEVAVRTSAAVAPGPLVPVLGFSSGHRGVVRHQSVAGT